MPFALACLLVVPTLAATLPTHKGEERPDPSKGEVQLESDSPDWNAFLVLDNGPVGVWTVESFPVFPQYGSPEIVGLDDLGQCHVMVSYSGKWTPNTRIGEGKWLGGLAHGDVDPRVDGAELYTGGKLGNLYQLVPHAHGALDARLIAYLPGKEIHTIVAGDLDPRTKGPELLVFTRPGALYRVTPTGPDGTFETELLEVLPGRVRDAVVLPAGPGEQPEIATITRAGTVALLRVTRGGTRWTEVHRDRLGGGRLAFAPPRSDGVAVLYSTRDDGRILRHERGAGREWRTETIYVGPQGPRGIATGRFHADPDVESVVVFGYSAKVQLLTRKAGRWTVETLFTDRDKGHWLCTAELDGRNGTREIVGSGYGGRIFMLARPPGYGLEGVLTEPPKASPRSERPVRMAATASDIAVRELSPLRYGGGFPTKTLVFETLVRRDATGAIVPALASSWRFEDDGRRVVFTLREGARFHDGKLVTAADVAAHFRRWVGLPEHAWLRCSERIIAVRALSDRELAIEMDQPYALLADLCAINPCGIQGPGALDAEGDFVRPIGTGPFQFESVRENGRVLRYRRPAADGGGELLDLVRITDEDGDPAALLARGALDVLADDWVDHVPRDALAGFESDAHFDVFEGPGSSVVYLSFRLDRGPTASRAVRRTIQAAVDREELVREVERGRADPCTTWAAPTVASWPRGSEAGSTAEAAPITDPLVFVVASGKERQQRLAEVVARQLRAASLAVEVRSLEPEALEHAVEAGEFDLRIERTWGVPYDPYISLVARFLPPPPRPSAASDRYFGVDPELTVLVRDAMREPDERRRSAVYDRIQRRMDAEASIVPLFVPRRYAVVRAGMGEIALDHDLYRVNLGALSLDPIRP